MANPSLYLGSWRALEAARSGPRQENSKTAPVKAVGGGTARLPAHHLVTHGAIFGMTGSGKTGLLTVLIEEALGTGVGPFAPRLESIASIARVRRGVRFSAAASREPANEAAYRSLDEASARLRRLSSTDAKGCSTTALGKAIKNLAPRWFVMRDVHARAGTILLQPRWAMSFLRGPMTRNEIRKARELFAQGAEIDAEEKSGVVENRARAAPAVRKKQ